MRLFFQPQNAGGAGAFTTRGGTARSPQVGRRCYLSTAKISTGSARPLTETEPRGRNTHAGACVFGEGDSEIGDREVETGGTDGWLGRTRAASVAAVVMMVAR